MLEETSRGAGGNRDTHGQGKPKVALAKGG
jgi:hypothetical protein